MASSKPRPSKSVSLSTAFLIMLGSGACLGRQQAQSPVKGSLKIEGRYVERLLLRRDDGHSEVLVAPKQTAMLPIGHYLLEEICLSGGYNHRTMPRNSRITISADKPAVLKVGGPLTQTIGVQRRGKMLELTYIIAGLGGETYTPIRNANQAPAFAVYRGDWKIASGEFEFG